MGSELTSGWIKSQLCNLAADKPFAIVDGPFGTQLHHDEYVSDGVPVVRIVNLSYDGRFLNDDLVFITKRKAEELSRSTVNPNDIIIAKTGATIGKLGILPVSYERGIIASSCLKITPNPNLINPKYLLYLLTSEHGQRAVVNGAIGSTRATINITPFGKIEVYHPIDTNEQSRIVEILDTISDAIQKTEAVIAKVKQVRVGLIHDLLTRGLKRNGELRPSFEKVPEIYKKSEIGWIPKEWVIGPLGLFFPLQRGFDITQEQQQQGNIPVVSSSGITSYHSKAMCEGPGVVIGRKGKLGIAYYLEGPYWPHDTSLWVKDFRGNFPKFAWLFLGWLRLERFDAATSVPTLNRNFVHPMLVAIPERNEQENIVTYFEEIEERVHMEESYLKKLVLLKLGLMSDLLTGRVRLQEGII